MSDGLRPGLSDLTVRNVGPASYGVSMTVIDTEDLDEESASGHVHGICLKTGPPRRVGVELEWLVRDVRDPALPIAAGRTAAAVLAFPAVPDNRDHQGDRDNPGHHGNGFNRVTGDGSLTGHNSFTEGNRVSAGSRV